MAVKSIKIVSDGTYHGTLVTDATTGAQIDGVRVIRIDINPETSEARATLEIIQPELDVTAKVLED